MKETRSEKLLSLSIIMFSALLLCGVNRCQQDYYFAVKTNTGPTATATESDDEIDTPTPTGSITPTEIPELTDTPEPTETPELVETPKATLTVSYIKKGQAAAFLRGLSSLDKQEKSSESSLNLPQKKAASSGTASNWLGQIKSKHFDKKKDSDRDGFTDELEKAAGSDANNPQSLPQIVVRSNLAQRFAANGDNDGDGVSNEDEKDLGLSALNADSDQDGCPDGLEVLEGTDPRSPRSVIHDSDGDCLSDEYEAEHNLNPFDPDTDHDGLSDGQELLVGSDPLDPDTDGDGILDGKEVAIGSDPLVSDTGP